MTYEKLWGALGRWSKNRFENIIQAAARIWNPQLPAACPEGEPPWFQKRQKHTMRTHALAKISSASEAFKFILKPKSGKKTESPWIIPIFGGRLISKKIEELFRINEHLRIQRNPQVAYNLGLTWEKVQKCLLQQVSWSSHPISPTKRSPLAVPLGKAVGESWDFSVPKPMHLCRSHTPSYHLQGYNVPFSPANFFLSLVRPEEIDLSAPRKPITNGGPDPEAIWNHLKPPITGWLGCGAVSISSGMFLFFLLDISPFYRWFSRINVHLWKLWKGFRSSMFDWFGGAEEMALLRVFKGGSVLTTTFVVSVEFQVVFPSAKVRSSQANTKGIGMEPNLKIGEWNVHPEARLGLKMVRLNIGYHHVSSCIIWLADHHSQKMELWVHPCIPHSSIHPKYQ